MNAPLVSVIMPAYNGEKFIGESIDSVLNQSYSNWELVIVDDASTDNTVGIINEFKDSRIRLLKNATNQGISYSTNLAIKNANGEYLALLDDDDLATSNRLEIQVAFFEEHEDIDILGGRAVCIDDNGTIIKHDYEPLHNPRMIKAWMHFANRRFSNGTTMIRAEFVRKYNLHFKDGFYGIQDFKFMADSSKVGNISSVDRVLQFKRVHDEEASFFYINKYGSLRREKYAQLQRESLYDSGFRLNEADLKVINEYLPEGPIKALDLAQTKEMVSVLRKIVEQAKEMDVDYLNELEIVCKKIIIEHSFQPLAFDELVERYLF